MKQNKIKLPFDLPSIIYVFIVLSYYKILIKLRPVKKIIDSPDNGNAKKKLLPHTEGILEQKLYKLWYLSHILQKVIFRDTKPCLSRSLFLFKWCQTKGLKVRIVIGVKKNQSQLKGHSWIVFNEKPLNEDENKLKDFKIMIEKSL